MGDGDDHTVAVSREGGSPDFPVLGYAAFWPAFPPCLGEGRGLRRRERWKAWVFPDA